MWDHPRRMFPGAPWIAPLIACDVAAHIRRQLLDVASSGLLRSFPDLSASCAASALQKCGLVLCGAAFFLGCVLAPLAFAHALVELCAAGFLLGGGMRVALAVQAGGRAAARKCPEAGKDPSPLSDPSLPDITVLLPLFHEGTVLPGLVRALSRLRYPPERLHFFLLTEAEDTETRAAARAYIRDKRFTLLEIPPGGPRTKPKACNYALPLVQSPYVVVFDAEDRPEPDQLLKAVAAFRRAPEVMCLQARLEIDNGGAGWIAALFALDYRIWYHAVLPGFCGLGMPMPLGGSSNYFRTRDLRRLGGWDAFNVTEDADLGVRMARFGARAEMLDAVTYESAPVQFRVWLRQRTRWLKGYMQTLKVHTRHPMRFARQCGPGGVLYLVICMAGSVASALCAPLLWLFFLLSLSLPSGTGLWSFAACVGVACYGVNFCIALRAQLLCVRKNFRSFLQIFLMPVYWSMISLAAWRAVLQFVFAPYLWEKTPHSPSV